MNIPKARIDFIWGSLLLYNRDEQANMDLVI